MLGTGNALGDSTGGDQCPAGDLAGGEFVGRAGTGFFRNRLTDERRAALIAATHDGRARQPDGIAETAFVIPSDAPGTFDLRWFSPLV